MASREVTAAVVPVLEDLLDDQRLARLFSDRGSACVLQLWVLQIKAEQATENRVIYGRLLPYNHASQAWSASDRECFESVGKAKAQVVRLNLYHSAVRSADVVRGLSAGRTITEISRELAFMLPPALEERFGSTALVPDVIAFRPVSYLLNRAALGRHSPASPHESAGALSASITRVDKIALLRVDGCFERTLAQLVCRRLKEDTGMDFRGADSARLGDLECLVFPTLDEGQHNLLSVVRTPASNGIRVCFDPAQLPAFAHFQVRLCITNDREVVYTAIASTNQTEGGRAECEFRLGSYVYAVADTAELEIFGEQDDAPGTSKLCCRWAIGYVREISFQTHVSPGNVAPIRFDWLEKTTRGVAPERTAKALTFNRGQALSSRVGGRITDQWVPANRDLDALLRRLDPPSSSGGFFPRWGCSNGEGRLRFVEWLRSVLAKHPQSQIAIFDPYFEASGLALLLLGRPNAADYLVFTSVPKQPAKGKPQRRKGDSAGQERLRVLLASCQSNAHLFGHNFNLRIYGLKEGWLHDRYLLIMGPDGLPVAGYNLSNSLQMASENFPLLVTPIPADTLFEVERYKADLMREACATHSPESAASPVSLLYDSAIVPKASVVYEPLAILKHGSAGDVLSGWLDEASLKGLHGEPLVDRMHALGLIRDGSLKLEDLSGLQKWLAAPGGDFSSFDACWEVLGELLAHSIAGDSSFKELSTQAGFLTFLKRYLQTSFARTPDTSNARGPTVSAELFQETLDALLHCAQRGETYHYPTKYKSLTWPEYYAIRILWTCAPADLLDVLEAHIEALNAQSTVAGDVALAILSQSLSEMALSLAIGIDNAQRRRLLASSVGLFQWMGLEAAEQEMHAPDPDAAVTQWLASEPESKRTQVLGWMVQRAAGNRQGIKAYRRLVSTLLDSLPPKVPAKRLGDVVDAMRGHMRTLPWVEPWLFNDVIAPLLSTGRASVDAAGNIWMQELVALLGPKADGSSRLFDLSREGQTTNVAAALFAQSSAERQKAHLRSIERILSQNRRIIQQPLASTTNWAAWYDALTTSLWIAGFARWARYYQRTLNKEVDELEQLAKDADALAAARSQEEWDSASTHRDMIEFIARVDQLQDAD
ncbi:MAG TPA: VPA1262 family protein [Frateuria sp.]|uniref:VPA1262 family protein n=1 Tax=Frateuria sp. TaxID=2211372 RepID=UPI002D7F5CC3|nr:VPA1262 family protein [Frateuria sp.]HET6803996.1 VPA1262 family protein [Frateuria sp.]